LRKRLGLAIESGSLLRHGGVNGRAPCWIACWRTAGRPFVSWHTNAQACAGAPRAYCCTIGASGLYFAGQVAGVADMVAITGLAAAGARAAEASAAEATLNADKMAQSILEVARSREQTWREAMKVAEDFENKALFQTSWEKWMAEHPRWDDLFFGRN
jgi:hypothetical protein